jgi:hypothetical protein
MGHSIGEDVGSSFKGSKDTSVTPSKCILLSVLGAAPRAPRQCCLPVQLDLQVMVMTLLFDKIEDQWKLRNRALHSHDDAEHSLFRHARLCTKAIRLYAKAGTTLLALDRPILSRALTTYDYPRPSHYQYRNFGLPS